MATVRYLSTTILSLLLTFGIQNLSYGEIPDLPQESDSGWELTVTVSDENDNSIDLVIGTSESATDGFDSDLDQYAPPSPPSEAFDARIIVGNEDYFRFFKPLTADLNEWEIKTSTSNGSDITLSWSSEDLNGSSGQYVLSVMHNSGNNQYDMESTSEVTISGDEGITITHRIQQPVSQSYSEGWQLIGYPVAGETNPYDFFPNAIPNTLYGFDGVYTEAATLTAGKGYWLRLSDEDEITIAPPMVDTVQFDLEPGWHLISGPGTEVGVSGIQDENEILVYETLQGYDGGYVDTESLVPGRAYWILSEGTGTIVIHPNTESLLKQPAQSASLPGGFVSFEVKNEDHSPFTFFIGGTLEGQEQINPLSFSVPPLPPNGAFDIRFDNDSRLVADQSGRMIVQSPGDSLTFTFNESVDQLIELIIHRNEQDTPDEVALFQGDEVTVDGSGISEIEVQVGVINSTEHSEDRPIQVRLDQNYPNPFNPTTVIHYDLPQTSKVQLEIFDMTGQRVAVLENSTQPQGRHTVEFDASALSSGVYIYRLQAVGTALTRKMTLIK